VQGFEKQRSTSSEHVSSLVKPIGHSHLTFQKKHVRCESEKTEQKLELGVSFFLKVSRLQYAFPKTERDLLFPAARQTKQFSELKRKRQNPKHVSSLQPASCSSPAHSYDELRWPTCDSPTEQTLNKDTFVESRGC